MKEIAKFFSGLAANQVLTHGALAIESVQFSIFGINYTRQLNIVAVIVWAIILIFLFYYAWIKAD